MPGRGFVADTHLTHQGSAAPVITAATATGKRPVSFIKQINSQGETETCVPWTFKETIDLRASSLGIVVPPLSASGLYALALQLAQAFEGTKAYPLVDQGCQPSLQAQAIRSFGAVTEADRPWNPASICTKLSIADVEAAQSTIGFFVKGFYGVVEVGDARGARVRQALDAGMPVPLSVPSSSGSFENPDGLVLSAPTSYLTDNHMVSLVDYRSAPEGAFEYLFLNHWGTSWGSGGLAWCDDSFIQYSNNLFIVDIGVPS
jgi:hypothetical protein